MHMGIHVGFCSREHASKQELRATQPEVLCIFKKYSYQMKQSQSGSFLIGEKLAVYFHTPLSMFI
jgi:hypothetical protein